MTKKTIRIDYRLWIVYAISTGAWLVANIDAPLRYTLDALQITPWHALSLAVNYLLVIYLLYIQKRKSAFIPLFYSIQPAAYVVMYFLQHYLLGTDYSNILWKFFSDIVFFAVEIACFLPFLWLIGTENPFAVRKGAFSIKVVSRDPKRKIFRIVLHSLFVIQIGILVFLCIWYPMSLKVRPDIFIKLLGIQIVFAVLLSLKEELIFRWIFLKGLRTEFGSVIVAIILQGLPWGLYHVFFGEGTGVGLWPGAFTLFAAVAYGIQAVEFGNIVLPFFAHFLVEFFGFYLLYGPLIVKVLQS